MIIDLIIGILFAALVISGATIVTRMGHDGYRLRVKIRDKVGGGFLPMWVGKPLLLCSECMSSLWGSAIYWLLPMGMDTQGSILLLIHTCILGHGSEILIVHILEKLLLWPFFILSLPPVTGWILKQLPENAVVKSDPDKHT